MKKINWYSLCVGISIGIFIIGFMLRLRLFKFIPIGYFPRIVIYAIAHIGLSLTLIISYILSKEFEKKVDFWKIPLGILFGLGGIFILNSNLRKFQFIITIGLVLYLGGIYLSYLHRRRKISDSN